MYPMKSGHITIIRARVPHAIIVPSLCCLYRALSPALPQAMGPLSYALRVCFTTPCHDLRVGLICQIHRMSQSHITYPPSIVCIPALAQSHSCRPCSVHRRFPFAFSLKTEIFLSPGIRYIPIIQRVSGYKILPSLV
jgi:hypothetical protein